VPGDRVRGISPAKRDAGGLPARPRRLGRIGTAVSLPAVLAPAHIGDASLAASCTAQKLFVVRLVPERVRAYVLIHQCSSYGSGPSAVMPHQIDVSDA